VNNQHSWRKGKKQLALVESGGELGESDFYPTPEWVTRGLLEVCRPSPHLLVLEPAAGGGAIVRLLLEANYRVRALELRPRAIPALRELCPTEWGCWLRWSQDRAALEKFCGCPLDRVAILTNPPFGIAREFVESALMLPCPLVVMLLRLNVLGSRPWSAIFRMRPPTTLVPLMRRPSFSGDGKTSMDNYAWLVWELGQAPLDFRPIG
jgi:hypothetical protein